MIRVIVVLSSEIIEQIDSPDCSNSIMNDWKGMGITAQLANPN